MSANLTIIAAIFLIQITQNVFHRKWIY